MRLIVWGIRLLIPLVVLYTIGYYLPGFSALTIPWLILLTVLIFLGSQLIQRLIGGMTKRYGRILINFLVAAFIIFTVTLAIEGGSVPLWGALIAASIISLLTELVYPENMKVK
jgi:hypothetical protein